MDFRIRFKNLFISLAKYILFNFIFVCYSLPIMNCDDNTGIRCTEVSHPNDLAPLLFSENGFTVLNVNVRSLSKNYSKLMALLKQISFKVRILIITETWLSDTHSNLYAIKGYKHYSINRCGAKGKKKDGGIRIYFCETLDVDIIENFSGSEDRGYL